MPNTKSAMKELRKTQRRVVRNLRQKRSIKKLAKDIMNAVDEKKLEQARSLFPSFQKAIDKAAKNHVIKKNTAARSKSRLNARIKQATSK